MFFAFGFFLGFASILIATVSGSSLSARIVTGLLAGVVAELISYIWITS